MSKTNRILNAFVKTVRKLEAHASAMDNKADAMREKAGKYFSLEQDALDEAEHAREVAGKLNSLIS